MPCCTHTGEDVERAYQAVRITILKKFFLLEWKSLGEPDRASLVYDQYSGFIRLRSIHSGGTHVL